MGSLGSKEKLQGILCPKTCNLKPGDDCPIFPVQRWIVSKTLGASRQTGLAYSDVIYLRSKVTTSDHPVLVSPLHKVHIGWTLYSEFDEYNGINGDISVQCVGCQECGEGYYGAFKGAYICEICPPGRYNPNKGQEQLQLQLQFLRL